MLVGETRSMKPSGITGTTLRMWSYGLLARFWGLLLRMMLILLSLVFRVLLLRLALVSDNSGISRVTEGTTF